MRSLIGRLSVFSALGACVALVLLGARAWPQTTTHVSLPALPQVPADGWTSPITLTAKMRSDGTQAFGYNGGLVPPVLRVNPGGQLRIQYVNALAVHSTEMCALGPCMDMTNLHFHGMGVSPNVGQDDVLTMLAMPGQTLRYDVHVPARQEPGLYWYHTHPHGESDRQVLDGMSGAIVVEGIDRYVPEVRSIPERILVVRTVENEEASGPEAIVYTVNGAVRPSIAITPGQRQFWRILNASADTYVDLAIDQTPLEAVAVDGLPFAVHDPARPSRMLSHIVIPPAGRVEAIVTGPPADAHATLRTRGVDSGPAGDPMPARILADLSPDVTSSTPPPVPVRNDLPTFKPVDVGAVERSKPSFVVTFTEGHHEFFINGQMFSLNAPPMTTVRVGTYVHWRVVNDTSEIHPFHIHQVHFLTYAVNGAPLENPVWSDTMDVPQHAYIDVILDATNPVIRGMSVFHCHILSHEDKGMMAKVLFR